jgi:hypothetical protein
MSLIGRSIIDATKKTSYFITTPIFYVNASEYLYFVIQKIHKKF